VRVREWPSCASEYIWYVEGGRTATPGLAIGFLRTGTGPKAGEGEGAAITAVCMFGSPGVTISGGETDQRRPDVKTAASEE
jgi:hypothetical protein